jgi:hypothetical protein
MAPNFPKISRDPEMSEGPHPGPHVQVDAVEKRTIDVEKHCFDHSYGSLFQELRHAVSSIGHHSCE